MAAAVSRKNSGKKSKREKRKRVIVQGVKNKIGLKASDVAQGLKFAYMDSFIF